MKISEILKQMTEDFTKAGIDTPRLDAMILLENVLGESRSFLISHPEYELNREQHEQIKKSSDRRIKREPVSHITGIKEFYGRGFLVSNDVLVPRPETELVIDAAKDIFNKEQQLNVLDLGTGSGVILLTLLKEFENSRGVGVDASKEALAIAKKNAYNLGIENVEFVNSNWCENLKTQQKFSLIVSNPPYIPAGQKPDLEAELMFEPDAALFAGDDGLKCYRQIAGEVANLDFDFAIFEIGIDQEGEVKRIFEGYKINLIKTLPDLAGIPRTMVFKKSK